MKHDKELKPRSEPRQQRSRKRVDFILDTTERLVLEHGFEVVTTQMIAQETHLSPGVLYHYFPGKHGIFAAVANRAFERLEVEMRNIYATVSSGKTYKVLINEVVDSLVEYWRQNKSAILLWQVLEHTRQMDPVTKRLKQISVGRNSKMISAYLPDLQPANVRIKALIMEEICFSLLRQTFFLGSADRKKLIAELKTMLIRLMDD